MSLHSMIFFIVLFVVVAISNFITLNAFHIASSLTGCVATVKSNVLSMEYIPDGLSKAQWQQIKKKEADDLKAKGNLGALGTTKFKSRSFEAWQKAGGKHLFPVDPTTTPYEERPYMQRKDGDWEGTDLKKRGIVGKGQGQASNRLKIDEVYDDAEKQGKLNSASFFGSGIGLPWTQKAADNVSNKGRGGAFNPDSKLYANRGTAGKKLSQEEMDRLKKNLVKPIVSPKNTKTTAVVAEPEVKKKLFGFF